MRKEYLDTHSIDDYLKAMEPPSDIFCEVKGKDGVYNQCVLNAIHCTCSTENGVVARIDAQPLHGDLVRDCPSKDIRLYKVLFEDGDYVHFPNGDIIICAGVDSENYLYHALLPKHGELKISDLPDGCLYSPKLNPDRLCDSGERHRINSALRNEGKLFEQSQGRVVDKGSQKGLYDRLCSEFTPDAIPYLKGFWCAGYVESQRGVLKSYGEIQECINIYESRLRELTQMCNEIYEKLNNK